MVGVRWTSTSTTGVEYVDGLTSAGPVPRQASDSLRIGRQYLEEDYTGVLFWITDDWDVDFGRRVCITFPFCSLSFRLFTSFFDLLWIFLDRENDRNISSQDPRPVRLEL